MDALGNVNRLSYDVQANFIGEQLPGGSHSHPDDARSNLTTMTHPLGLTTTIACDPNNLTSYTDAGSNTSRNAHDGDNNLL